MPECGWRPVRGYACAKPGLSLALSSRARDAVLPRRDTMVLEVDGQSSEGGVRPPGRASGGVEEELPLFRV